MTITQIQTPADAHFQGTPEVDQPRPGSIIPGSGRTEPASEITPSTAPEVQDTEIRSQASEPAPTPPQEEGAIEPEQFQAPDTQETTEPMRVQYIERSRLHVSERFDLRSVVSSRDVLAMSKSISEVGILQPLGVCPHPDREGEFEIGFGKVRYLATADHLAGVDPLPCVVYDVSASRAEAISMDSARVSSPVGAYNESRAVAQAKRNREERGEPASNEALGAFFRVSQGIGSAGWVSERLTIDRMITPEFIGVAGISDDDLVRLCKAALLEVAQVTDATTRLVALCAAVEQLPPLAAETDVEVDVKEGKPVQRRKKSKRKREPVCFKITEHSDKSISYRICPQLMTSEQKREARRRLKAMVLALGFRLEGEGKSNDKFPA